MPHTPIPRFGASVDLVTLIAQELPLKRRGKDWWAPCPFHTEKTASFKVGWRGRRQAFHCFGCGAHGDAIDWIRLTRKVDYREACRILGQAEPPKPDPERIWQRQAVERRAKAIDAYRQRNLDCCCPDWLLET